VRVQIVSILFAAAVFAAVFEMVRRRYLRERYALLWLAAALALFVLAAWKGLLTAVSHAVGIKTPSNAFFVIAFAFLLLLLLHFSAVVSRLADETRVLAQRVALLESRPGSRNGSTPPVYSQPVGESEGLTAEPTRVRRPGQPPSRS
jgi:hypothetical protein